VQPLTTQHTSAELIAAAPYDMLKIGASIALKTVSLKPTSKFSQQLVATRFDHFALLHHFIR
jgi:hypothetical protein